MSILQVYCKSADKKKARLNEVSFVRTKSVNSQSKSISFTPDILQSLIVQSALAFHYISSQALK